ncbi:MAG: PEP-CTERM sorting domain-containing protein [Desulfobacterales bacterium]|nr:PEP-CTERM sorting domain-containing protein [Desulfobacterales bacterium]
MDDPAFVAWATGWTEPVNYGTSVSDHWKTPEKAMGKAKGTSSDVVCLGEGGSVTMTFKFPITNGDGWDFAIFENSPSDNYLELAYVEVSSDGRNFIRFSNNSLTPGPVWGYVSVDPRDINGFAGKYRQGYGTPFDLSDLAYKKEVISGAVDINNITHVKLIDVKGGTDTDTSGDIIYDAYTKSETRKGFDLDAIGVMHHNPIQIALGDVNGDKIVDLSDVVLALKLSAGVSENNIYAEADANGDGKIGIQEVIFILRKMSD